MGVLALLTVACGGGGGASATEESPADGSAHGGVDPAGGDESTTDPGSRSGGGQDSGSGTESEGTAAGGSASGGDDTGPAGDGTASLIPVDRGRALPVEPDERGPVPVSITISSIDVDGAPVRDVGVEPDGQMEIPGAEEVGWYRFGSLPGEDGSSVLAAHIAYNGVDGVFRHLDRAEEGDLVKVDFDDGSASLWVVRGREQYDKDELPAEIWARDGDPRLVLITCGGDFNPELRSYDSNVVLYAEPLDGDRP